MYVSHLKEGRIEEVSGYNIFTEISSKLVNRLKIYL